MIKKGFKNLLFFYSLLSENQLTKDLWKKVDFNFKSSHSYYIKIKQNLFWCNLYYSVLYWELASTVKFCQKHSGHQPWRIYFSYIFLECHFTVGDSQNFGTSASGEKIKIFSNFFLIFFKFFGHPSYTKRFFCTFGPK